MHLYEYPKVVKYYDFTNYLKNINAIYTVCFPIFNKHTITLYPKVITSVLVASVFAIGFVQQQALAQSNQASAVGSSNQTSSNSTSGTATASGSTTDTSSDPTY